MPTTVPSANQDIMIGVRDCWRIEEVEKRGCFCVVAQSRDFSSKNFTFFKDELKRTTRTGSCLSTKWFTLLMTVQIVSLCRFSSHCTCWHLISIEILLTYISWRKMFFKDDNRKSSLQGWMILFSTFLISLRQTLNSK